MKRILILIALAFLLIGCADTEIVKECVNNEPYGFFGGLWHGIIIVFSFIISLFNDDVAVYAVNNTGGWYDFGFLIGLGAFGGSTSIKYKSSK